MKKAALFLILITGFLYSEERTLLFLPREDHPFFLNSTAGQFHMEESDGMWPATMKISTDGDGGNVQVVAHDITPFSLENKNLVIWIKGNNMKALREFWLYASDSNDFSNRIVFMPSNDPTQLREGVWSRLSLPLSAGEIWGTPDLSRLSALQFWLNDRGSSPLSLELGPVYLESSLPPSAVILTFDDGWKSQIETAAPVMAEQGLTGTAYIIPELIGSPGYMTEEDHSLITAPNGTLVATLIRYANEKWEKKLPPVYFLSHDHGHTWEGPCDFDKSATVDDIAFTMNTSFVRDGEIFILFRGGKSNMTPGGPQTLWVSGDNGESFSQRSTLPFDTDCYYWAAGALDDGKIIVYTYDAHLQREDRTAEQNLPYVISKDGGRTWSDIQTTHFAKGIRNMQLSGKLGEFYFIQGRSGSYPRDLVGDDPGPDNFVLYSSRDGIHWDEGIVLMSRLQTPGGGDCYSANEVIGKYDPATPEKLLIHGDVSYSGAKTNMHQWWVSLSPCRE